MATDEQEKKTLQNKVRATTGPGCFSVVSGKTCYLTKSLFLYLIL